VASGRIVYRGLSMAHSPRLYNGRLYVLTLGAGEFGAVDPDAGHFEAMAFCPGYLRGLCFLAGHAVVGLSELKGGTVSSSLASTCALSAQP
jgi:uncharacterized protein (TIGR03032 family)